MRLTIVAGVLVMVAGCGGNMPGLVGGDDDTSPTPDAAVTGCASNEACAAIDPATPLCAADGVCVACVSNADCADPLAPTCDDGSRTCRACVADADCASDVCDGAEGSCIAATDVYYVDDTAVCAGADGSQALPFCTIDEALAAFAITPRNYVRVLAGAYVFPKLTQSVLPWFSGAADAVIGLAVAGGDCLVQSGTAALSLRGFHFMGCDGAMRIGSASTQSLIEDTVIDGGDVGIECRGQLCVIDRVHVTGALTGFTCASGAHCRLDDCVASGGNIGINSASATLEVNGGVMSDNALIGINMDDSEAAVVGTAVEHAGKDSVVTTTAGIGCSTSFCTLERVRVSGSRGAGVVVVDSDVELRNSVVVDNGSDDATLLWNGGVVLDTSHATRTVELVTIFGNRAPAGQAGGIVCSSPGAVKNSIVWANTGTQLGGMCTGQYSDIDQASVPGVGNIRLDPMIVSATPGAVDAHLAAGSPCIDAGDPAVTMGKDVDGDPRPMGSHVDIGADERAP